MDSSAKRYLQYFGAPVLSAAYVLLSFCLPQAGGVVLGTIALFFLIKYGLKKKKILLHWADISILVLLLAEYSLTIVQSQGFYPQTHVFSLICSIIVYFVLRFFLCKEKQIRLFINSIAGFVILLAIPTIGSFFFFKFNIEYEGFYDWINFKALFQPLGVLLNDWSTILLLSTAFLLIALAYSRFKSGWFWILLAGCGLLAMSLFVSFSRGIYISILIGTFVFVATSLVFKVIHLKKLTVIVAGIIFMGILAALPVFDGVKTTAGFSVTTSQVRSTESRMNIAHTAFELFKKHPVIGVGTGNFSKYTNPELALKEDAFYTGKATNTYLQLLVEQGVIGFVLWVLLVGLLLFVVIQLIKSRSKNNIPLLIVFSVFVAVLFREITFSTFFSKPQMQLLFFVLAAWIVNQDKKCCYKFSHFKVISFFLSVVFIVLSVESIFYKIAEKRNNLSITKYQEHDFSGALASINSSLKLDPKNAQLLANKGFLLYELQQTDSVAKMEYLMPALACYQKAVKYSPQDPYLHQNLASLFSIFNKTDSAAIHYQKACELSDNTALFHANRGLFFEKNEKTNEAWNEYQKAIRLSPDILDSELGLRLNANRKEAFNQMLDDIANSLSLKIKYNDSPILKSRLAKILLHQGDTAQATALLEQVSMQLPNMDRVWYQLGMLKLAQNDTLLFLKNLNRAILLDSRDYLYPLALGDYYYPRNKANDAIYYYKQALVNFKNIYTLHFKLAQTWYGYKTLPNDIISQNRLEFLKPSFNKVFVYDKLIGLYNSLGQDKEAILFERYKNNEASFHDLLTELNKLKMR